MSENRRDNETENASVEDPLSMQGAPSNEITLISEIPNMINDENVIIAPGKGKKKQFHFYVMNFMKNKHFVIFLLMVNLAIMPLKICQ